MVYALPSGCGNYYYGGSPYYNCGGTYYAPQYQGDEVTYIVVEAPEGAEEQDNTNVIVNPDEAPIPPEPPPP